MLQACWRVQRVGFDLYLLSAALVLVFFLLVSTLLPAVQALDCNYTETKHCGNLPIPYPFGMSHECGLPDYRISCKPNASYGSGDLAFLQIGTPSTPELQVLQFFSNSTLVVNSTDLKAMPADCNQGWYLYGHAALELLMNGSFLLAENNWFVVIGCNADGNCTATTTNDTSSISCTSSCYNEFVMPFCNYYACCISPIPPNSWSLDLYGRGTNYAEYLNVCGFATVLNPNSFTAENKSGVFAAGHYGLSLSWTLKSEWNCCSAVKNSPEYPCHQAATCLYDKDIQGYTCSCTEGYRGDGYKAGNGCQDIDECKEEMDNCEKPPLGICSNTIGSYECRCSSGEGTGLPGNCSIPHQSRDVMIPALLGGVGGAGVLAFGSLFFCLSIRAYRKRKDREDNFKRIGGDQLTSFLFSERELTRATKGFADDHVLGEGGFGKVYWGKLSKEQGDMKVAIKRAKTKAIEEQVAQIRSFVREIVLLSKCGHKNVVRLLGCCVETAVPLLGEGDSPRLLEATEQGCLLSGKDGPIG